MNRLQTETVSRIIGATHQLIDSEKNKAAIAYGATIGAKSEVKQMIIKSRLNWLNWLTTTQRHWQSQTKNPNKAKHHDSIQLREKYVKGAL